MTASPQDAPSGDSLPSRSDAGAEPRVSGRSDVTQEAVEGRASPMTSLPRESEERIRAMPKRPRHTQRHGRRIEIDRADPIHVRAGYPSADAMFDGLERRAEG